MDLEFDSSLGQTHFRTHGTLVLRGDLPLSYLMLNATFWKGDRLVESARYMMIGVDPGQKYDFEIFKVHHLRPQEGYTCVLVAEGPLGRIESETRLCRVVQAPLLAERDVPGGSNLDGRVSDVGISDMDSSPTTLKETSIVQPEIPQPGENPEIGESFDDSRDDFGDDVEDPDRPEETIDPAESYDREAPENGDGLENREESVSREDDPDDVNEAGDEMPQGSEAIEGNWDGECLYVGSTGSDKYHLPDCRYAQKIKYEIWFDSVEDACDQGYVPCKVCNPP